jgi:AraC-like DNA-binding protein
MLSARIEQMAEYLRQRYRDPVGRLDLARHFGLTPQYVDTLFRRELRTTPTEFLNRHRVLLARNLIRQEGLSVQAAAEAVGFSDAFYFSKVFKRHLGVPPSKA